MTTVGAFEAKTHLSELLRRVEQRHEKIVIQRNGRRVAMLVPCERESVTDRGEQSLREMRELRSRAKSAIGSIRELIDEGRK